MAVKWLESLPNSFLKKACPLHKDTKVPSKVIPSNALTKSWELGHRVLGLGAIVVFAGLFMIFLVYLLPPVYIIIETSQTWVGGVHYSKIIIPLSVILSGVPFLASFLIGLTYAPFISIFDFHTGRRRLIAGMVFAGFVSFAAFIDQLLLGLWVLENGAAAGLDSFYFTSANYILSPTSWLPMLLAYLAFYGPTLSLIAWFASFLGDYLLNLFTLTGRLEGLRLEAKGGVISAARRGYFRCFTEPTKWQGRAVDPRTYMKQADMLLRKRGGFV
ncbi:MAG: hypothetical protein ACFFDP_09350 [Promethearchaeota archaeon]